MVFKQLVLALTALFAASAPLLFQSVDHSGNYNDNQPNNTNHWPTEYEGKALTQLPLTDKEQLFIAGFPGKIKRFSDGHRELIIRWVEQPTRMLHPAIDCFKGIGYHIAPLPIQTNNQGIKMGCFSATKDGKTLKVCEYVSAADGQSWSDVSSWYWHTFFNSQGFNSKEADQGWLSVVIAQNSSIGETLSK